MICIYSVYVTKHHPLEGSVHSMVRLIIDPGRTALPECHFKPEIKPRCRGLHALNRTSPIRFLRKDYSRVVEGLCHHL